MRVDLLALGEQLVQLRLPAHATQRRLRILPGGEEEVLDRGHVAGRSPATAVTPPRAPASTPSSLARVPSSPRASTAPRGGVSMNRAGGTLPTAGGKVSVDVPPAALSSETCSAQNHGEPKVRT